MMVFSLKLGDELVIDLGQSGLVSVGIAELTPEKTRLQICCPGPIPVHRKEVFDALLGQVQCDRDLGD
ncbi:MAG: hypothetical protein R3C53_02990 [Pirellulaceae bacterium]